MKIKTLCAWCGKELWRYPSALCKRSFCCNGCRSKFLSQKHNPENYIKHPHLSEFNTINNPKRMDFSTRCALRLARIGKGNGKSYSKMFGVHAHRIIAVQMLGRELRPGEVVHHIDGNKRNNAQNNLSVLPSQSTHARIHAKQIGGDAK